MAMSKARNAAQRVIRQSIEEAIVGFHENPGQLARSYIRDEGISEHAIADEMRHQYSRILKLFGFDPAEAAEIDMGRDGETDAAASL